MASIAQDSPRNRRARGRAGYHRGKDAEALAVAILEAEGWEIKARRERTKLGEIDVVAEKSGLLAFVEVKARRRLSEAAESLSQKQRTRLVNAAELILARNPSWGANGVRFDVIVIDAHGTARRIANAFRIE